MFFLSSIVFLLFHCQFILTLNVSSTLQQNTVWTVDQSPYRVIGTVGVPVDVTLTIQAGVQVIFDGDSEIFIKGGSLKVLGTLQQPVIFSSNFKGEKWMITFKASNLSQSLITSASFFGPKLAIQITNSGSNVNPNEGTLLIEYCLIANETEITSNGFDDYPYIENRLVLKPYILVKMTAVYNSTIRLSEGCLNLVNVTDSIFINSTITVTTINGRLQLTSCFIEDTQLKISTSYATTVYIDDSNLINVVYVNQFTYGRSMNLIIRRSTFFNGTISNIPYYSVIQIVDSTLTCVNITSGGSLGTQFTLRNSTFNEGSIVLPYDLVSLISSNITLIQSPIVMGGRSEIRSSSITQTNKTDENKIGVQAASVTIQYSSIFNFDIGISISELCNISSSNIYNNSLYNLVYTGNSDVHAIGNWWGTTNPTEIEARIVDGSDNLHYGTVIYSDYSHIPIVNQFLSYPAESIPTDANLTLPNNYTK